MRPSLAPHRRREMLEALADCIVQYGIPGTTAERIAERAGWTRGHVRHYLGTREQQLQTLVAELTERYAATLHTAVASAAPEDELQVILNTLFGPVWQSGRSRDDALLDQLIAYESMNPGGSVDIRAMYEKVATVIRDALLRASASISTAEAEGRGFTLVSLAYGAATMTEIGWSEHAPGIVERVARELLGINR